MSRRVLWAALCLLTISAMARPAFAQDTKFAQCFREKAMRPCDQWTSNQDFCHSIRDKLYLDESRACYGRRWSIPNCDAEQRRAMHAWHGTKGWRATHAAI